MGFPRFLNIRIFFKDWVASISCAGAAIIDSGGKWSTKEGSGLKIGICK